ncbi:hypothetical protein CAEBREN_32483 [Caenorhabditis brenneri]|uniref:Uncharacterized protein n=1 Tax=Caenorhabditis brenneri TaxID=135651 RepID=G0M716_CAEBE|nr:hypothetical protein CAEBREN_32483 [Caenorhabditis brenneri]
MKMLLRGLPLIFQLLLLKPLNYTNVTHQSSIKLTFLRTLSREPSLPLSLVSGPKR